MSRVILDLQAHLHVTVFLQRSSPSLVPLPTSLPTVHEHRTLERASHNFGHVAVQMSPCAVDHSKKRLCRLAAQLWRSRGVRNSQFRMKGPRVSNLGDSGARIQVRTFQMCEKMSWPDSSSRNTTVVQLGWLLWTMRNLLNDRLVSLHILVWTVVLQITHPFTGEVQNFSNSLSLLSISIFSR